MPLHTRVIHEDYCRLLDSMYDGNAGATARSPEGLQGEIKEILNAIAEQDANEITEYTKNIAAAIARYKRASKNDTAEKEAEKLQRELLAVTYPPHLSNFSKKFLEYTSNQLQAAHYGYNHDSAHARATFISHHRALNRAIRPLEQKRGHIITSPTSNSGNSAASSGFSPASGNLAEKMPRTPAAIKKAVETHMSSIAQHMTYSKEQLPANEPQPITWETPPIKNQNAERPSAKIRCENDTCLKIEKLDPKDDNQVRLYIKSIKAFAAGRVTPISNLYINLDKLPASLALAIKKAAQAEGVKTFQTKPFAAIHPEEANACYSLGAGLVKGEVPMPSTQPPPTLRHR